MSSVNRIHGSTIGVLSLFAASAAQAETRAIVIGIDEYEYVSRLHGAVADARDIGQALKRAGARDVTIILNHDATRANIEAAWDDLLSRTQQADEIVFSYAGHGSQTDEAVAGSEADGKDEFLVLTGFNPDASGGPATGERLVDDMINTWFKRALEMGAQVVAVVDACHSGTAFRKLDSRIEAPPTRYVEVPINAELLDIPMPPEAEKGIDETKLIGLTWIAAAQDDQTVPEIRIADTSGSAQLRGATSWAFARALEGAADVDKDGKITRGETYDFVEAKVRALAASRQTPNFFPLTQRDLPITRIALAGGTAGMADTAPLRIAILHPEAMPSGQAPSFKRGQLVLDRSLADFVYDAARQEMISYDGDVVAQEISPNELDAVIDKQFALRRLQTSVEAGQLRTRVLPDDRTHVKGASVTVSIEGIAWPYLTLFNLAGDGTVQYLYPTPEDPPTILPGKPFELGPIYVVPPFGADHIVAVSTSRAPDELRTRLWALNEEPNAPAAVEAALATITEPGSQVGVQGIFTGPGH